MKTYSAVLFSSAVSVLAGLLAPFASAAPPSVPGFEVQEYATVDTPNALSFDSAGYLYVGNAYNLGDAAIHKVAPGGSPVVDFGDPLRDPDAVIVDYAGTISGIPGAVLVGGAAAGGAPPPIGYIVAIEPDGTTTDLFGSPTSVFRNPSVMRFDHSGRLLFTDPRTGSQGFVYTSTGEIPSILYDWGGPYAALAVDQSDRLYTLSPDGRTIRIHDAAGVLVDGSFATHSAYITEMTFAPSDAVWGGDLYAISGATGQLLRIDSSGVISIAGTGFNNPSGLTFGAHDGRLYVSSLGDHKIYRISPPDTDGDGVPDLSDICPADPLDECNPDGSTAELVDSSSGGSVETPDGNVTIDVDPGDLVSDTTLSITETVFHDPKVDLSIGATPGLGQAVAFYVLEPDGLQFASDVTLTIVADVSGVNPRKHDDLDVYRLEDTNDPPDGIPDTFVSLGATCAVTEDPLNVFTAACTIQLSHLSTYAPIAPLDRDGDGIADDFLGEVDACPLEDATGFDVDTNGCIDSFEGLVDLVGTLVTEGVIAPQMENSLISKVENAENSADREKLCTAVNELEAFQNQVAAQTGKKISAAAASEVVEYADSVIAYLESQLPEGGGC